MYKRTHTCGDLNSNYIGNTVQLNGWINKVRLHGKIVFIDLRDRYGKTQLVFDENIYKTDFDKIKKFSIEDVLSVNLTLNPTKSPTLVSNSSEILFATDLAAILLGCV